MLEFNRYCRQCDSPIIEADDAAQVCLKCGGRNRRVRYPNKFHMAIYRIFYYFWNPILKSNPGMLIIFEAKLGQYRRDNEKQASSQK